MARAHFRFVLWLLVALGLGACGGSSSETPWPVEPEQPSQAAPPGESTKPPIITEERPDAGKSSTP